LVSLAVTVSLPTHLTALDWSDFVTCPAQDSKLQLGSVLWGTVEGP